MGKESTRDELLDAGVRLFGSLSRELLRGLTSGIVAREAGFHRQTFYRYWETQAEYVDDLIRTLLSPAAAPTADGARVLPARRESPDGPEGLLRDMARYDFARLSTDPAVRVRIGLLMMQALDGDEIVARAEEFYDRSISTVEAALGELLESWGRAPAEPLTVRDLVRGQQAMLGGMLLQHLSAQDTPAACDLYETLVARFILQNTVEHPADMD